MYVASFSKYISSRNQRRAADPRSQSDSLKFFSMGKKKTPQKAFYQKAKERIQTHTYFKFFTSSLSHLSVTPIKISITHSN